MVFAAATTPEALPALLAAGADPNEWDASQSQRRCALDWAVASQPASVPLLLAAGADPSRNKSRCLFEAAFANPALVPLLLAAGAHPDPRNTTGQTPLMRPVTRATAELLAGGADPNARRKDATRNTVLLELLAEAPLEKKGSDWSVFVARLSLLVMGGARVNDANRREERPLMWAACTHLDVVDLFLGAGASLDDEDRDGYTALCWAARAGRTDTFARLLASGADAVAWESHRPALRAATSVPDRFAQVEALWFERQVPEVPGRASCDPQPARLRL